MFHGGDDLELRDLVDGIDVVHPLLSVPIALVHGIDPDVTRLAPGLRLSPLADRHRRGPGLFEHHPPLTVLPPLPQVIDMRRQISRHVLVARVGVLVPAAAQRLFVAGPLSVSEASSTSARNLHCPPLGRARELPPRLCLARIVPLSAYWPTRRVTCVRLRPVVADVLLYRPLIRFAEAMVFLPAQPILRPFVQFRPGPQP